MRTWVIDAGGSSTTALLDDGTRWLRASVNPASVGATAAEQGLLDLLRTVAGRIDGQPSAGWLATATVGADTAPHEPDRLTALARRAGLTGELVISRDIVPLLLAPPLGGRGVALVCGTGSGFLAADGSHPPSTVGGCEYLGSDEGSAFALGLDGLRAAVRSADGREPPTALAPALAEYAGVPVPQLARRLAAEPFPKAEVAALAAVVCRCWLDGDVAAAGVVRTALSELLRGVRAGRDAAGLAGDWSAALGGGVFRGCPEFATALSARIADELGGTPVVVHDPPRAVLAALHTHRRGLPSSLADRWAWRRRLDGHGGAGR